MEQKEHKPFHMCPFVDGNTCKPDCPLWGKTVLKTPVRDATLPKCVRNSLQDFEGCLLAAGMLALVSLANEKGR